MQLLAHIKARRDGTLSAVGVSGQTYAFQPNAAGEMVCEVSDPADAAAFLALAHFEPADASDFAEAEALLGSGDDDADDDGADGEHDDGDGDAVGDALLVEANTPLQPARKKASAKKRGG